LPALGRVVRPHPVPAASISGVATWPKLLSTAGKPEPQAAVLFPLWDLVSYFFRLWFGERNQHINDFFPQKPLNNSFWRVFAFLLAVWFWSRWGQRAEDTQRQGCALETDGLSWACAVPVGPVAYISTPALVCGCPQ
uniref:Uncharacterized protein n=1 Tax=Rhinolophus ferrumequinum TaxID=59479 RepID=A0A671E648_RHIFE